MSSLYLNESSSLWLGIAGGGALLVLIVLLAGYFRQSGRAGVRFLCGTIKFVAVALLLLALLEPMWTGQTAKPGSNDFLVLIDNSEGMQVQEGDVLLEKLREQTVESASWFGKLDELFRVETFAFDTRIRKAREFEGVELNGQRSDLFHAVDSLQKRYAKRPLAGMLVLTDGNATDAAELEALELEVPVFPVIVEGAQTIRDLAIRGVSVSESAFEDAPVTVTASVDASGLKGKTAVLSIKDADDQEVRRETHRIAKDKDSHPFRMRFRPVETGVSFYTLEVREEAGAEELTQRNNAQPLAIDRGTGPYRVLYLTGRPNWEYKFLRRALEPDEEIQLIGLIRVAKREPKFEWRGRKGESSNPLFRGFNSNVPEGEATYDKPVLIRLNTRDPAELRDGFPKERERLFSDYHAIVIDDLESDFFTEDQQLLVEKFVSLRGGSVLMLGGQESMQLGGYNHKPIGQMLPVYLDRLGGDPAEDVRLKLTREGWLEPWARLRLTAEEEDIRLAHMPAFKSVNRLKAIKPGASLVSTVVDDQQREFPALATHRFGEGRVAALTIGDVWRWGMDDKTYREDMQKWWRQVVRWLVVDVPDFIEIETRWAEESGMARMDLAVRVRNPEFRAEENATVELQIETPGSEEPSTIFAEPSLEQAGLFTAEFICAEPGPYRATALVDDSEGIRLGSAEAGWVWHPAGEEFASLRPNRDLMEELAEKSGGRLVALEELDGFVKTLPKLDVPVTETWSRPLWHQPWVFALVLALFVAEWGLRRWRGMA